MTLILMAYRLKDWAHWLKNPKVLRHPRKMAAITSVLCFDTTVFIGDFEEGCIELTPRPVETSLRRPGACSTKKLGKF